MDKQLEILNIKNKLIKLGIQIEDSIKVAKSDSIRESRIESLEAIEGSLSLIYELQMSLVRSNMKASKLESYIEQINNSKIK